MHLHSLQVIAFGPFGAEVRVDFDELNGAGLFLFTGPTGAGKSSVLDAVCFGLYGVVPGSRQSARQLRSDHAAADVKPVVQLEFSVGQRRFLIRRSPAWQRPKRRGTGFTTQHAAVTLEEFQDGVWHVLSTRLDETGDLISTLLGMQPSQFTQVAMLPQGEFQQFLRAKSDERQAILQRLFRTDRFEAVERWLRERRTSLRSQCQQRMQEISALLSRVEEAADVSRPDSFDADHLSHVLRSGDVTSWVQGLSRAATLDLATAATAVSANTNRADCARASHQDAIDLAALQHRGCAAANALQDLTATSDIADHEATTLLADTQAQPALALARELQQASARLAAARDLAEQALDTLRQSADTTLPSARAQLESSRRSLHAVQDFAPQQQALDAALERHRDIEECLGGLAANTPALRAELATLPTQREALETTLIQAEAASGALASHEVALGAAEAGRAAACELEDLAAQLMRQQAALNTAVQFHQDRRQTYQDLREARINAMAGELASRLAVGCSCPVCGSETHPHPAAVTAGVGADAEDAARIEMDDAAIAVETLRDAVRTLEHRVEALTQIAHARDVAEWEAVITGCRDNLEASRASAEQVPVLRSALGELGERESFLRSAISTAEADAAQFIIRREQLDETIAGLKQQLETVLDGLPCADLAGAQRHLEMLVRQLADLVDHLVQVESCETAAQHAHQAVTVELGRAGFADLEALEAAALSDVEREELLTRQRDRTAAMSSAQATLAEPEVTAALLAPAPDLMSLAALAEAAELARDSAVAEQSRLSLRARRLSELAADLAESINRWQPISEDLQLATGLAELVEGKSADNEYRMRLSAYVLSERLSQVVDAANDRLARMGRDRFTLEQSDQGAARDRRGGLGLRVRDAWTSSQRETGTLSGGETFVVSLALALGLADTVTAESGGTRIETLFVDEGFGSLDAESLEGVLDTLDSLREGGRTIGVVSHVAEMRERIPTQVQVSSSPQHGSTLHVVLGA